MTPKIFRVLLVSSLVTGLIAGLIDICIPSVLPKEFAQAQAAYDSSLSDMTMIVVGVFVLLMLVLVLASAIGLYLFRHWAPRVSVITTLLACPLYIQIGAFTYSGYAMALLEISSTLWGAVLTLAYFSPLKDRFIRPEH